MGMIEQFTPNWHEIFDDKKLDFFVKYGYMILDDCFGKKILSQLQKESELLSYQNAHLTHGQRLTDIRGDSTVWINENCPYGLAYLKDIERLGLFFNQVFFTNIKRGEAHYARYPVGHGYQWHRDNPAGRNERIISAVYYLNNDWGDNDGGEISLVDKTNITHQISPKADRLVIFDSNLLHQVEKTHRERYSIATWLRCDDVL